MNKTFDGDTKKCPTVNTVANMVNCWKAKSRNRYANQQLSIKWEV